MANKRTLSEKNDSLFCTCLNFIKTHPLYAVLSALVLVLAYGFYATKYTFNLDQLVPEYYDGNVLITAGRWAAPIIHLVTNWMKFSPFWHTAMMMVLFWLSGLCWINLFKKASSEQIKDTSLLVFWCLFPIYPMIAEQLTYPILNIALAYVLTPISIWLLYPILFEKKFKLKNLLISLLFMVVSVDMYESFAPVFLTGFFAVLLLRNIFSDEKSTLKSFFAVIFKVVAFLAVVIVLDLIISKAICYISSGSFDFWYNSNTSTKWGAYGGLIDSIVWFLRSILAHYFIVGAGDFSVLFFDIMLFASIIMAIVFSIKRRSAMPLLLFACLCAASVSLCFIEGAAPPYRCEQALPVFVAFVFMLLFQFAANKKVTACLLSAMAVILVFSETQQINNYAVKNYEIFEYGYSRLREIGNELEKYDTSEKPVAFMRNEKTQLYPKMMYIPERTSNPLYSAFRKTMCKFWNTVLPDKYYENMNSVFWSYSEIEITDSDSMIDAQKSWSILYFPYIISLTYSQYYVSDGYEALKRMGYKYIPCTEEEYKEAQTYLVPDDYTKKFTITETDKMIIVQLMAVK